MSRKPKRNPLNKVLAQPGDPLVTERGIAISPDRDGVDLTVHDGEVSAKAFKPQRQRAVKDLPADMQMMKAVSCVFMLSMLGITDRESADALGISIGDLKAVKVSPVYTECFNEVLQELINANSEMLSARIAAYAGKALDNVAEIASNGKKEETRLSANRDLLDRGNIGTKAGLQIGITASELRIQVVEGGKTADISLRQ